MLVTVVIPSYNRMHTLSRALDSVFAQTASMTLEVIVVDDGSTDGTQQLVESRYPQLVYIQQANQGVSAARNTGIKRARGDWVAFLDSDDEWLPHKLQNQLQLLSETGLKVCHTEEVWVRNGVRVNQMNKHRKRGGWIFQTCLPLCAMSPSSMLMHRDIIESIGYFDETLPACEDYDYWLRLTSRFEVAFVDAACLIKYGGHADQLSRRHWGMDRFRVQALSKILAEDLNEQDRDAVVMTLRKKLTILLKGAQKRQNLELIDDCNQRLTVLDDYIAEVQIAR